MFQVEIFQGNGLYEVQQYNESESVIWNYKSAYLYLILLYVLTNESVNTMDVHFWTICKHP